MGTGALYESNEFIPYAYYCIISTHESAFNDGIFGSVIGVVQDTEDQYSFKDYKCDTLFQSLKIFKNPKKEEGRLFCLDLKTFKEILPTTLATLDNIIEWALSGYSIEKVKPLTFLK